MLRLKLQYFGRLTLRANSLEKTLMLGKIEGRRKRGWERTIWLDGITQLNGHEFEQAPGDGEGQESCLHRVDGGPPACCSVARSASPALSQPFPRHGWGPGGSSHGRSCCRGWGG